MDCSRCWKLPETKTCALVKTQNFEVIRMMMLAGKEVAEHRAKGEILVHCLEGSVLFNIADKQVELKFDESPNPPHRLLLGNDAYDGAIAKLDELREEFKAWEAVSRGADFPEPTPAAMA
jgi:hypothetical protein